MGTGGASAATQSLAEAFSQGLSLLFRSRDAADAMIAASPPPPPPSSLLSAILFPTLPPLMQTLCSLCRLISLLIVAPIAIVAVIDFAEYAVIRTLGLRRRKVRVKPANGKGLDAAAAAARMQLSPAQLRRQTTLQSAPLLTPGAYDAETLLRHRARSISSASSDALEEWSRTNGAFARVAEVRAATSASNSQAPSPPGGSSSSGSPLSSSHHTRSHSWLDGIGHDGAMGLSESEAEGDSGSDSAGPSSPVMHTRHGLKSSQFYFTPIPKATATVGAAAASSPSSSSSSSSSSSPPPPPSPSQLLPPSSLLGLETGPISSTAAAAAAAAADLEPPSLVCQ